MWIQITPPLLDFAILFEYGSSFRGQTLERFGLYLNYEGRLVFGPAVNYASLTGTIRLDHGTWRLVTASYTGPPENQGSLFVDGILADRGAIRTPATDARTEWRIGARLWGRTTFRGMIDDVRVYNIPA